MNKGGPPAVQVTDDEGIVWLDGLDAFRIKWTEVSEIGIEVMVVEEVDHCEAFWILNGGTFGAPLDMVVNADQLKEKLMSFAGFDHFQYEVALDCEREHKAAYLMCWKAL